MSQEFFSQFGEDKWIHENLLLPKQGFFVEVGAYDGLSSSNTLFFERIGWRGFVVEALPEMAAQCLVNRRCPVTCYAVGDEDVDGRFYRNVSGLGSSSLTGPGDPFDCRLARLRTLLEHFQNPKINLLSIDTEGTELEVWKGVLPHRPEIVVIEFLSGNGVDRSGEILEVAHRHQYRAVHRTEANLILVDDTCFTFGIGFGT